MPKQIVEINYKIPPGDRHILVCQNTSCAEKQAAAILSAFEGEDLPDNIKVRASHCQGQCSIAPTVRILPDETWYCRVLPEDVPRICQAIREGTVVTDKLNPRIHRYF